MEGIKDKEQSEGMMMEGLIFPLLYFVIIGPVSSEEGEDAVKELGWIAIGIGVIANVIFILYNRIRKVSITYLSSDIARSLALMYKPMLNMHIILNIIGYVVGMVHGLSFLRHLDPISLSLAVVMSVLVISGLLLRYESSRNAKIFNNLLHGQAILTVMLIMLIMLHIGTADD